MSADAHPTLWPALDPSWQGVVGGEFAQPYMHDLRGFLADQLAAGTIVRPLPEQFFAALNRTPFDRVKVVILGQDPYFNPGEAHGLSFSVPRGVKKPSSLRNIFKELASDLGVAEPPHGCLEGWADQGVLLLNSVLSVVQGQKGAHAGRGWERFTDAVIRQLNERREGVAFVLWGSYAREKAAFIDRTRHCVVESAHPSGLSAYRGFIGSRPFSRVNAYLSQRGITPVDWRLV